MGMDKILLMSQLKAWGFSKAEKTEREVVEKQLTQESTILPPETHRESERGCPVWRVVADEKKKPNKALAETSGSLAGTAVLAVGLWLHFDSQTKSVFELESNQTTFYTGVYILIGAGALMMLVGFLGCCGASQESQCMLGLFFFFLLVIFALEIGAGIWGFSNKEKIIDELKEFYMDTYKKRNQPGAKETLKAFQLALNCCGITGSIEQLFMETCPKKTLAESITTKPCPDAIDEVFKSKFNVIGAVGLCIAVMMIIGMIFSMILCCAIRREREMV